MSRALHTEYEQHVTALLTPLTAAGVRLYRQPTAPAPSLDAVWIPLRPALRVWRVPQATQRWLERQLCRPQDDPTCPPDWTLHWDGHWRHLLVSLPWVQAHVLHYAEHPVCQAYCSWQAQVHVALMHHGVYNPATNHEPAPGEELDALERREHLRATFDACFPWFKTLPRYRILKDEHGQTYAEEMPPQCDEEADDDDLC